MSEAAVPLDRGFEQGPGTMVALSPLVRRIVAPNAGPMTFKGTNTYVVGHGRVAVIDPGPPLPGHVEAILAGLPGEQVSAILVTHTHADHSPGARLLKARTGAPIIGCAPHRPFRAPRGDEASSSANDGDHAPDRVLADGECHRGDGFVLEAIATPGHTMNHLAFALPEERALFSGDHVMAWSTTVVAPPAGSMGAYMGSLERLRDRRETVYWPGHGGPVRDPARFVRALHRHRRQREAAILARLTAGDETVAVIRQTIYEHLDPSLDRPAALAILAHLEDLEARGMVTTADEPGMDARWRRA